MSKDVTRTGNTKNPKRISSPNKDKRVFSNTAERTHVANTLNTGRPMRGGIRL